MIIPDQTLKRVKQKLGDSKRFNHSVEVAKMTTEIIKWHHLAVDPLQAYLAGLVHDYAKYETNERFKEIVNKYNLDEMILKEPASLHHAFLGPFIIQEELGISDGEIHKAVFFHPVGHPKMSLLSEILFLADFISQDRTYEVCERVREVAKINFKQAIAMKLKYLMNHLEEPHLITKNAYQEYKQYL